MNETKHEKFCRLAENRTNNILKQLELLSNLSNKSSYDYSQQDVDKILKAIKSAVSNVEHSFKADTKNKKFSLR